jgi:hypothetical protein
VGRAICRSMEAVRRELCELRLSCGPARLLPDSGRDDTETFLAQARQRFRLIEDRRQLGELVVLALSSRGSEGERS